MVERILGKDEVAGSIPACSSNFLPKSQKMMRRAYARLFVGRKKWTGQEIKINNE